MLNKKKIFILFLFTAIFLTMSHTSFSIDNTFESYKLPSMPKNKIILKAYEFEIDSLRNIIFAKGGIKIYEDKMYLSGNEATYYQGKNIAEINGNINLNYRDFKVKCQKVTLYGDQDRRVEAVNGVVFNYQNINGKSDSAKFYPKEQKIVLKGNATAFSRSNQLSGEEIIVYIDSKRIISRGNTTVIITKNK